MSAYIKSFEVWRYILNEDDELLEKYNNIWNKVSISMKEEFASQTIHNKKFLKTKIKSYRDEVTKFNDKEMAKVGSSYIYLVVIFNFFVLKKDKKYYPQVFFKKYKYIEEDNM